MDGEEGLEFPSETMPGEEEPPAEFGATGDTYEELAQRHQWEGPPPTLFVDSNVINELFTFVDLERALGAVVHTEGLVADVEARRLRARDSLWMSMALDDEGVASISLGHEPFGFATRRAPPGSWGGDWVTAWLYFVREYVCPGWKLAALNANAGGTAANDTLIAGYCAKQGIPLVTRDAGLVKKAESQGVSVVSPGTLAARRLRLEEARERFFARYDKYSLGYAMQFADENVAAWGHRLTTQCRALGNMREQYEFIWTSSPAEWQLQGSGGFVF